MTHTTLYPCPCCGYVVFDEPPGSYAICPICFWEDDQLQLRFVRTTGANRVCLIDGQANYARWGACEDHVRQYVRAPRSNDQREAAWRPIDAAIDQIEDLLPGKDYGATYPTDATTLYYWRRKTADGAD